MSRIEGKIVGENGEPIEAADILAALARDEAGHQERRREAFRRYLSASEGWQEASAHLSGTFAPNGIS